MSPPNPFAEWRDCYVVLATGAATFASAMFIVVTLGGRFLTPERASASVYFQAATMAHLVFVLFGCALALAPWPGPGPAGLAFVAYGLVGLAYAVWVAAHVHRRKLVFIDHLCYGAAPPLCYAVMAAAGAGVAAEQEPLGVGLLASAIAALLAVSIRNAWDLLVFFAGRADDPSAGARETE